MYIDQEAGATMNRGYVKLWRKVWDVSRYNAALSYIPAPGGGGCHTSLLTFTNTGVIGFGLSPDARSENKGWLSMKEMVNRRDRTRDPKTGTPSPRFLFRLYSEGNAVSGGKVNEYFH